VRILEPGSVRGDDRRDERWRPMRVVATMGEPLVHYGDGLHLDGPLSWGAYLEYVREHGDDLPPLSGPWAMDFDLPLARWTCPPAGGEDARLLTADGELWGWCCSAAVVDWVAQGRHDLRKRPALEAMRRYTGARSHHTGLGPMKAKDISFPTLLAFEIEWYALGDRDAVARLLGRVHHLGKLSRHGLGRVLRWTVEPMEVDWSIEREGRLMRRMPEAWPRATVAGEEIAPIRAPYHHRSRRVSCGRWPC
jgi:hypothetical protein